METKNTGKNFRGYVAKRNPKEFEFAKQAFDAYYTYACYHMDETIEYSYKYDDLTDITYLDRYFVVFHSSKTPFIYDRLTKTLYIDPSVDTTIPYIKDIFDYFMADVNHDRNA